MGNKKKIFVQVFKEYSYVKAVLDRNNPERDAVMKAETDVVNDLREIVANFQEPDIRFFTIKVITEPDIKLRNKIEENPEKVSVTEVGKALAMGYLEKKYKTKINAEDAPDFFVYEAERDEDGDLVGEGDMYLKPEIEREYLKKYNEYMQILDKLIRRW